MTTVVVSLITAVVSSLLGGAVTYWTARRNLQLKFDESLRDLRIGAYKELWKLLEHLAKYGRPDPLTKSEAQRLRDDLGKWYFHTGGLVLSTPARHDYFALLDALELVIAGSENILAAPDDEYLRVLGSRLRTAMTRDVGTRRTFVFKGEAEREHRLVPRTYVDDCGNELVVDSTRRFRLGSPLKRIGRALLPEEPRVELSHPATLLEWDPDRQTIAMRTDGAGAESHVRLFLLEDGQVFEGPGGWQRGSDRPGRPSVIWTERQAPLGAEDRNGA